MTKRPVPTYTYAATITRVLDGDTLWARIDLGFRMWAEIPLRLHGINCPEKNTTAGKAAKAYVQAWLDEHPLIVVATFKDPEKYGRWLAVIAGIGPDQLTLNSALIEDGHGLPWDGQGPRPVQPV